MLSAVIEEKEFKLEQFVLSKESHNLTKILIYV